MKLDRMTDNGAMPIHIGGGAVCVLLLGLGWFMGLGPLLTETHQATAIVEQADQTELDADKSKADLARLTADLQHVQERLEEQPINLEQASQINPLLAQLADWSEAQGLAITRTSSGRPIALAYYDYVPISITGEGGYANLLGFLRQLYDDRGDVGIVSFRVRRLATGVGVTFELELAWYVVSDDSGGPESEATASVPTQ